MKKYLFIAVLLIAAYHPVGNIPNSEGVFDAKLWKDKRWGVPV